MMYDQDWRGVLPTNQIDGGGITYALWQSSPGSYSTHGWNIGSTNEWSQLSGDLWDGVKVRPGPYTLYRLQPNGVAYDNGTALYCPDGANSYPILRHNGTAGIGTNYALNQYLGGQMYYGTHGDAPLPRVGMLKSTTYWFTEMGVRSISPSWNEFFGVMSLGTTGAPQKTDLFSSWPWPWDYTDCPLIPQVRGHPNHSANFLFGDCHVEPVTRKQFQQISTSSVALGTFLGRFY